MTELETGSERSASRWLDDFGSILIRPRRTIRRILDRSSHRTVVPLVLLGICSILMSDLRLADLRKVSRSFSPEMILLIVSVAAGVIGTLVFCFYFLTWVSVPIGRFLDGEGRVRDVRQALGWGLAPLIVALIYRIPAFFLRPETRPDGQARIRIRDETLVVGGSSVLSDGWQWAVLFGALELVTLVWLMFVASSTLAEAHRFSTPRGLGTLVLGMISPLIIVIAALLAFRN